METDSEKEVHEPLLKRAKLKMEHSGAATSSNQPKEQDESDDADSSGNGNSSEDLQGSEMDRESVVSGDEFSELSNLSDLDDGAEESAWLPVAGPIAWVQRQMVLGTDPRDVIQFYLGDDFEIPSSYDQLKLWEMVITLLIESTVQRTKLTHINTLNDVVELFRNCKNIIVLTGAGVSVSCGIPDFRSENGIYARLAKDFPNLPNPQSMFDITFFKSDQRPFFKFAKEIYPGQFDPSPCHKFIRLLETHGKLLRNYTQNIDTLEKVAGVERAIECHGSFATATCMVCKHKVDKEAIRKDIFDQVIPWCPQCGPDVEGAVMKPDIVFFGESLPDEFHQQMRSDKDVCDLLIVIGSSLKVRPVSRIPCSLPAKVPQIIINREPLHRQYTFDVELLGNCDDVIGELCKRLGAGWELLAKPGPPAEEISVGDLPPKTSELSCPEEMALPEGKEAVVEHNADSGLGDLEAGASAFGAEGAGLCSGSVPASHGNGGRRTRSDRLVRLSSSDSGAESSAAVDSHGQTTALSLEAESSKPLSGEVSCSKPPSQECASDLGSSCVEVSALEDCVCDKKQDSRTLQHTCHAEKQSHDAETGPSQTLDSPQREAAAPHVEQNPSTSKWSESLSTRQGPIERKVKKHHHSHHHHHHHKASNGSSKDGKENDDCERELSKGNSHSVPSDRPSLRQRKKGQSIASRCKENQIIFCSPNRYIFLGAEVYSDDSDDSTSDDGSHLSISPMLRMDGEEDDEESQNTANSWSPASPLPDTAVSQGSSDLPELGDDQAIKSPESTPPCSPFAASDEGEPNCSGDTQDNSELDTVRMGRAQGSGCTKTSE